MLLIDHGLLTEGANRVVPMSPAGGLGLAGVSGTTTEGRKPASDKHSKFLVASSDVDNGRAINSPQHPRRSKDTKA